MDYAKKLLLQKNKEQITMDLDVIDILDVLYQKEAITSEAYDEIYRLNSRVDQVQRFLDILVAKGDNNAFQAFKDSLAKEYSWLWRDLDAVDTQVEVLDDSLEDSLSRGDVPKLPDHYVRRVTVEQNVANALGSLRRHKILALHGMTGSGKTTAVISVLRHEPELIVKNFNGTVFWLNFGSCKNDDDIVAQQVKLYRRSSSFYPNNSILSLSASGISATSVSSINSTIDSHSISQSTSDTIEMKKDELKSHFLQEPRLKECLLVLDEVNERKVLDAFVIGCKTLVTTRDTGILNDLQAQVIPVENSLTESESLALFASCIDVDVSQLPTKARTIHEKCKGSPYHIALIGADMVENKERLAHDPNSWNKLYLNMLDKKQFFSIFSKHSDSRINAIQVCVNSLDRGISPLFRRLSIIPHNAQFTAKVLHKLWNKSDAEIDRVMKHLRNKTLVTEIYDREKHNYLYEINDFIMEYLTKITTVDERNKYHVELLKSYNYDSSVNPTTQIVNDGYIAFFIGNHIKNSNNFNNTWHLFRKLYLDLRFLGNKGRLTGSADLIFDLNEYITYIVKEERDRDLLTRIHWYLLSHGNDLYHYPCTDIVQSVLQHESKDILYNVAYQAAATYCADNELYFEFLHEQNVEEIKYSTINVNNRITSVCFRGDEVLAGTDVGVIEVFCISTNKAKKDLPGNGSPIIWLGVCPVNASRLASLTATGSINIRYMDDYESVNVIDEEDEDNYNDTDTHNVQIEPRMGPYLSCRWMNTSEHLITNTATMIVKYDARGKVIQLLDLGKNLKTIQLCVPSNDDDFIVILWDKCNIKLTDWNEKTLITYQETDRVIDILTVPGSNKIILLKETEVVVMQYQLGRNVHQTKCVIEKSEEMNDNELFLSMAINNSGTWLFLSTNNSRIKCVDLKSNSFTFDLENSRGNVSTMCMSEVCEDSFPGADVLLTGTGDVENAAKVWYLDAAYVANATNKNGKVRLTTKFDVSFAHTLSPHTPSSTASNSAATSLTNTPRRHQSFINQQEVVKKLTKKTKSLTLDRRSLKPLNLNGISNGTCDSVQPLLAVVDERNNIRVMRGRRILTEIVGNPDEQITRIRISPCNQHIIYGLRNGCVKKYELFTKKTELIMNLNSPVHYLKFVSSNLLVAAAKNKCLMVYRCLENNRWMQEMLYSGDQSLGSQELLDNLQGSRRLNNTSPELLTRDSSTSSKEWLYTNGSNGNCGSLLKTSELVDAFWVTGRGLITIERNAAIKLWGQDMNLEYALSPRQLVANINCVAFKDKILVICDEGDLKFHIFELIEEYNNVLTLHTIQEYKLNKKIVSCDLTSDGNTLAMGLDTGEVIVWNVTKKRQLTLLRHHKTRVQCCSFSPVPERFMNMPQSPTRVGPSPSLNVSLDEDQPPLVLVTMATEIVWFNITHRIKIDAKKSLNIVSPLNTPMDPRAFSPAATESSSSTASLGNFFFGDHARTAQDCWKDIWKGKKSRYKEILSCIKLSGTHAKRLCHDEKFSCFVTIDNTGLPHIMNVMSPH